jgi:hypothetical protein
MTTHLVKATVRGMEPSGVKWDVCIKGVNTPFAALEIVD